MGPWAVDLDALPLGRARVLRSIHAIINLFSAVQIHIVKKVREEKSQFFFYKAHVRGLVLCTMMWTQNSKIQFVRTTQLKLRSESGYKPRSAIHSGCLFEIYKFSFWIINYEHLLYRLCNKSRSTYKKLGMLVFVSGFYLFLKHFNHL